MVLDIETSPILCWSWGLWNQNIHPVQIVQPSSMMCWSAKWLGEPDVEWRGRKPDGHKKMVKRIWSLMDKADAIIHYNGKSFDVPRIQREFLKAGLGPPSPFHQIDLLLTVRKKFRFDSNKLEEVADQLGIGRKIENEGFRLWLKCLDGESSAWTRMRRYNEQDVRLTEKLYTEKLRPWITSHPSHGALAGEDVCPKCGGGSDNFQWRGYATTATSRFRRFQCKACGGWGRATSRDAKTALAQIA